jgi:hypothetical protein
VIDMGSAGQCKHKADECARLKPYADTPPLRVALSNVERTWLKLADQCRRLEELIEVVESPTMAPSMDGADDADLHATERFSDQ